ncbi:hypothetical protein DKX38_010134 [Salix brachista]|uniref:Calcineurin-like phosphoesterase domain-containing protein n=1 Tax=Salix brachista TaxID=2182728 RepID=A0A5N5MET6_9ROSI|nr:hypothetical protein DKX38_010122 [Salix brachista]KAB5552823.1 hypothetical protein DKX38_010134 [Salix brachista]
MVMISLSALIHAPSPCFLSATHRSTSSPDPTTVRSSSMAASARIAVVGDVHDDWNLEEDSKALQLLQDFLSESNMCLHVQCSQIWFSSQAGDFGNENVELVQSIADLNLPKVVILGNHDAWKTQHFSGKRKDGVQRQLECLGEEHVAYKRLDFPTLKLSVVGGRPFSCGGEQIFRRSLLSARYGVQDMDGSADRIYNAALGTPEDHMVIFLAHNGPTGLGSNLNDICGKDWVFGGGDHGDPGTDVRMFLRASSVTDTTCNLFALYHGKLFHSTILTRAFSGTDLAQAVSRVKETTKINTPLVVFGHMHKELAYGNGLRKMIAVGADKTIYLNGAIVPRVRRLVVEQGTDSTNSMNNETSVISPGSRGTLRAFTLVEILEGRVDKIAETWVSVIDDETALEEEHLEAGTKQSSSMAQLQMLNSPVIAHVSATKWTNDYTSHPNSQLGLSSRSSFKKTFSCTDIERPCMDPDGSDLVGAQMPYMASGLKVGRQCFPLCGP